MENFILKREREREVCMKKVAMKVGEGVGFLKETKDKALGRALGVIYSTNLFFSLFFFFFVSSLFYFLFKKLQ